MGKFYLLNKILSWFNFSYVIQDDCIQLFENDEEDHIEIFHSIDDVLKEFIPNMLNCNSSTSFKIWSTDEIQFIQGL